MDTQRNVKWVQWVPILYTVGLQDTFENMDYIAWAAWAVKVVRENFNFAKVFLTVFFKTCHEN